MLDGFPSLTIPAIRLLAGHRRWVLWRLEPIKGKDGETKLTKIPYTTQHYKASSTNPKDWASYEAVVDASVKHAGQPYSGAGFVFTESQHGKGIVGVDLDKCRDPESGELERWAQAIVDRFQSYTEISPSGRGVHVLCLGRLPPDCVKKFGRMEVYSTGRYFTVTGNVLDGSSEDIQEAQDALDWLVQHMAELKGQPRHPQPKLTIAEPAESAAATTTPKATPEPVNGHTAGHANGHAHVNGYANGHAEAPRSAPPPIEPLRAELEPHARADAAVDDRLLSALKANNKRFEETWERTRQDTKDWSHSEYDLALASWMVAASWAPVEIMRALIAYRRRWGADLKLERNPKCYYYASTIRAARAEREIEDAQDTIRSTVKERAQAIAGGDTDAEFDRDGLLKALGVVWGCEIRATMRYSGDEPGYTIVTAKGEIRGDVTTLTSQTKFCNAFAAVTGRLVKKTRPAEHERRIQAVLDLAQQVDTGPDGRFRELVRHWLGEYLASREVRQANGVIANDPNEPFMYEGRYIVSATGFTKWMAEQRGQRYPVQKIAAVMSALKCSPTRHPVKAGTREARRNFWSVSPELLA